MNKLGIAYSELDDEIHPVYLNSDGIFVIDESFENNDLDNVGYTLEIFDKEIVDNLFSDVDLSKESRLNVNRKIAYDLIIEASRKIGKQVNMLLEDNNKNLIAILKYEDGLNILNLSNQINDESKISVLKLNVEYIEGDCYECQ